MNPVKELRARLGISKTELARRIGKSQPTIDKYEAELPHELAHSLAEVARKGRQPDLKHTFDLLSGQKINRAREIDLKNLDLDERELVELVVSLSRTPNNQLEQTAVQLLRNIRDLREEGGEPVRIRKRKNFTRA